MRIALVNMAYVQIGEMLQFSCSTACSFMILIMRQQKYELVICKESIVTPKPNNLRKTIE